MLSTLDTLALALSESAFWHPLCISFFALCGGVAFEMVRTLWGSQIAEYGVVFEVVGEKLVGFVGAVSLGFLCVMAPSMYIGFVSQKAERTLHAGMVAVAQVAGQGSAR